MQFFLLNSRQDVTTNKLAANCNLHLKEIKGRYVSNVRRRVIYKRRFHYVKKSHFNAMLHFPLCEEESI